MFGSFACPCIALLNSDAAHFQVEQVRPGFFEHAHYLRPIFLGGALGGGVVEQLAFTKGQSFCAGHFFGDRGVIAQLIAESIVIKGLGQFRLSNAQNLGFEAAPCGLSCHVEAGVVGAGFVPVKMSGGSGGPGFVRAHGKGAVTLKRGAVTV